MGSTMTKDDSVIPLLGLECWEDEDNGIPVLTVVGSKGAGRFPWGLLFFGSSTMSFEEVRRGAPSACL